MKASSRGKVAACCAMLALALAVNAQHGGERQQRDVAPGIRYKRLARTTPTGELWSIHVIEVSRSEKKIALRSVRGVGDEGEMQRERPTAMAQRAAAEGLDVVAVVNGDYDIAAPYLGVSDGLSISGGAVSTTGKPSWPAMGVTTSGEPLIGTPQVQLMMESRGRTWPIAALNKPLGTTWGAGLHLYTREFRTEVKSERSFRAVVIGKLSRALPLRVDSTVSGAVEEILDGATRVPLPTGKLVLVESLETDTSKDAAEQRANRLSELRAGAKVRLRIRVVLNGRKKLRDVVGGFPILVEGGRKRIAGEVRESLARRHPRTAVCFNERQVIFVVVDGRQPQLSVGMTLDELADLMVELGCTTAMNTDGGGSSVMAVAEKGGAKPLLQIVNSPSDGRERGRGNAWIVVRKK